MKRIGGLLASSRINRDERGLTAIEWAVVVALLAILAALVAGNLTGISATARTNSHATDVTVVQQGVDRFITDGSSGR